MPGALGVLIAAITSSHLRVPGVFRIMPRAMSGITNADVRRFRF
jgi:hypothetical protein